MKRSVLKRMLSLLLCLSMIIAWVPAGSLRTSADVMQTSGRVVDPNTMNQWQDYFGADKLSTEFAGGVWTDKSVMTNADEFMAEITMDDPDNNFLIALSALAANQKVVGYSSAPIDVMLVLDVSGSMDDDGKDTAMIRAANQAIGSLLSQNNNNRVGVVLYSGNSSTNQNAGTGTATVILPLDRYTTSSTINIGSRQDPQYIPVYLTLSNQDNVSVDSSVRNSDNQRVNSGSKNVSGGTYIQNGIYKAWGEFSKVTDIRVPEGNAQAGAQRTPVMVLMSDGQPTLATDSYNNVGTSESAYGNGSESSTSWQTVFLTQLTAAWVKGKMEAHYKTTPKFYTLGLGTGNSNYATAVLDPSEAYTTLDNYWNRFFNNSVNNSGNVNVGSNNNTWRIYKDSNVKTRDYVDKYWLAKDTNELLSAFKNIVDTIELAAADHVTLVEDIGEDMSGYITFTDELGIFMEVKDVKGLVLGDTLFTGYELAKSLQESSMGTQQNPTDYGNEFISTVCERLGIDNVTDAQTLVIAAYADGQLAYNEETGAYSNYIGWYSDDDGTYLSFWDKDTGITAEGAPDGTTWINKSYGYLGTAGDSDMMHVVVMVSTHIVSGMQVVQYKIPASLIPKVTYEVELEGSDPTQMTSLIRKEAFPLRLVYEVGLQEGLNSVNVEAKVQEAINAGYGHAHKEADGSYAFYTNLWGAEEGDADVDYNDPLNHQVAQSHFHPAVGNDRYYYTKDTPVYADTNGTLYTGSAAPAGDGFYRAYHYYTEGGYTTEYLPMSEYALQMAAAKGQQADGCWYIPEGAVFQQIDRFHMRKESNPTGTLEYYDYPVVVNVGDKYDTYAFLGNNGKINLVPAQGIKLTKTVTETVEGAADTFTFRITLSEAVAAPDVTDADGNALTGWSVDGNVITVTLKADETVYITAIPTGVTYTVEEVPSADYKASSENASGTVEANTVKPVDFVNIPKGYGNLIISKDVDHPFTNVPQALTDKEFTINVTLSGEDVANKQFRIAGTDPVRYITTDANGSFSVTLKDNGSLTVVGLPEGTTFITTETLDPDVHKGFSMDADRSTLSGTIVKDTAVQTHVVNVYEPAVSETAIDVSGTKHLTDEAGTFDWTGKSFTVRLEQYDPASGTYTTVGETQVAQGNLSYLFDNAIKLDSLGEYYFKVSEVIPSDRLEGMSYDATVGRFEVRVTDEDVDGQLELAVYDFDTKEQIAAVNGTVTYTKDFENIHTTDATYVEFTVDKDVVDLHNTGSSEAGYLFELYEVVGGVTATTPAYSIRTVLADGQGQATFHIPITKVGSRTFILKESIPEDADKLPGMIYDTSEYTVTVSATAEDGKLVPSLTVTRNGEDVAAEELRFENVIDLEPLVLKPYVTKTLVGREPLSDSEFTFNIVQTDGSFATPIPGGYSDTVSVGEGDKYFREITVTAVGTYYFRTTEVIGTTGGMTYDNSIYHVTVNVTAQDGKLVKDVTYVKVGQGVASTETDFVQFTNTYVNNDTAEVTLQGDKTLTGRTLITGEFSFRLKEGDNVLQTVTNRADGSFVFEPITYTAADVGTHTYTVVEVDDGKGGVSYDSKTYTVTVKVEDNGRGELVVTTTGADSIRFANTYEVKPVNVSFSGTKTWYNTDLDRNKTLTGGEFTFVLYESNEEYSVQGAQVATATNAADGSFGFRIPYGKAGHYYYLLREQIGDAADTGYDTGIYRIHISVYDNGAGQLVGSVAEIYKVGTGADTVSFRNTYTPDPTELTIQGEKELTGRTLADGEFSFRLKEGENVLQTVTNKDGKFTFEPISYDKSGTYTYQVVEVIPRQAADNVYQGVSYDTSVFDVTVTVSDNNGTLQAAYSVTNNGSDAALKFVNEYNITKFTDFDLSGRKELYNGTALIGINGRVFRFAVLDENGVALQTVESDENGDFSFENLPLTKAGRSTFTVVEMDDGLGGITYDQTVYTVTVDVTDNGMGDLIAGEPVVTLNGQNAQLVFKNSYTLQPAQVQLQVQKILENKTLQAGQFSFTLTGEGENQTKTNNLTGDVVFDAIEYTGEGTYRYTITEVIPDGVQNGITYDTHTVNVTVTVTDNGDGTLSTDVTYEGLRSFTNTYTVAGDPKVDISGTKTLTGRDLGDGEFTFVLTDSEGKEIEVTNVGNTFTFKDVQLPGLGIHRFTVTEQNTSKSGITYDSREYVVTVTVTDDGFGGMLVGAPMVTYHGVAAHLSFTNSYAVKPAQYQLSANKDYNKDMVGGEFSFTLTGEGGEQTKQNAADGTVTFDMLTFDEAKTYTYTVQEVKGDKSYITYDTTVYTVNIKVEDNGLGQLEVTDVTYLVGSTEKTAIEFTNTYTAAPAEYILTAEKTYTKTLTGGEFSFTLTGEGENQTKTNAAGGTITFDKLTFYEAKTYTYTVQEVKGDKSYITYDDTVYTVTVEVEDNNLGELFVKNVTVSDDKQSGNVSVKFDNVYVITGEPVFSISGDKVLTGRDPKDGEFTFVLTDSEGKSIEVTNVGTTFSFNNVQLPGLGEHSFTLTEKNTGDPTITYDAAEYTVSVHVADNNEGGMTVETPVITLNGQEAQPVFSNTYTEPGPITVEVGIRKTVEGDMRPEGFRFELMQDGKVISTVKTDAQGKATVSMSFSAQALGEHSFQLREVNTGVKYVTYDTTVYDIDVTVSEDGEGQLAAKVQLNGKDAEEPNVSFLNKFDPPENPDTGDSGHIGILASAMGFSTLGILVLLAVLVLDQKRKTSDK